MICKACGNEFVDVDNGMFQTCPKCRRPDAKIRKPRKFNSWGRVGRDEEKTENIIETKYGRDY